MGAIGSRTFHWIVLDDLVEASESPHLERLLELNRLLEEAVEKQKILKEVREWEP